MHERSSRENANVSIVVENNLKILISEEWAFLLSHRLRFGRLNHISIRCDEILPIIIIIMIITMQLVA